MRVKRPYLGHARLILDVLGTRNSDGSTVLFGFSGIVVSVPDNRFLLLSWIDKSIAHLHEDQ